MQDDDPTDDREGQEEPEENFAALLEQSMARPTRLEPGRMIAAKILKIGAEWVFIDVGQKGEGVLDVKELLDAEGKLTATAGGTLHVYYLGNEDGELRFTTRIGGGGSGTAQLEQAWQEGIPVEGRVEQEIKGGYEVRLAGGVRAFCPFSQLGLRRQDNPQEALGQTLSFKLTEFRDKGRSIVVSHRAILEEERRRQRETLRRTLREGMVVKGTVTGLREFGAFVDIGGLEGLLPVSEAGWGRTADISRVVQVGQECPDAPYAAKLTVLLASGKIVARASAAEDGSYRIPLDAGDYLLQAEPSDGGPFPASAGYPFSVRQGAWTRLDVTLDSGIR